MKKSLYLGLNPSHYQTKNEIVHMPIIQIFPKSVSERKIQLAMQEFSEFTHVIFTSKTTPKLFLNCMEYYGIEKGELDKKEIMALGTVTGNALKEVGITPTIYARESSQEGVVDKLSLMELDGAYILVPCSSLARSLISDFLQLQQVRHQICPIYDTKVNHDVLLKDLEEFNEFEEIVFTSPSTVDAFLHHYKEFPKEITLRAIGPITKQYLMQ